MNPFDYFKKVLPSLMAIKRMNAMLGIGDNPFDIKNVIQSDQMGEGSAVLGLASKYKMGLGSGSSKGGKIEYSDDYKFLEDQRYYLVKLLGNGRASSDNDFIYLDISGLKPTNFNVNIASDVNVGEVKGVVKTKEQA